MYGFSFEDGFSFDDDVSSIDGFLLDDGFSSVDGLLLDDGFSLGGICFSFDDGFLPEDSFFFEWDG